jgi:outer membrane protein TolC
MAQRLMHTLAARIRTMAGRGAVACACLWPAIAVAQPIARDSGLALAPVVDARAHAASYAAVRPDSGRLARSESGTLPWRLPAQPIGPQGATRPPFSGDGPSAGVYDDEPGWDQLPPAFLPWWHSWVTARLRPSPGTHPVDLDALIVSALAFSPRVRAVSQDVLIQETTIVEAQAYFDTKAFMDSKFFRKSEPVGNLLETGGPPRLRDGDWGYTAGLRKRTPLGGSWELSQRIGLRDSNSRFFVPENQGNARLSISFSQPLLNGFGKAYNTSLIVLAEIDTSVAMDLTRAALQDQLLRIAELYWELYLHRSNLAQRHRHWERARAVLEALERRRHVDALDSQIVRAQAAVAARRAELVRAAANVQNTETRIRALTNSPELLADPEYELIPLDPPVTVPAEVSLPDAKVTALQHRPEIDAASQDVRAAGVRLNMSRNELRPALDLILETYVAGLEQDHNIGQAWADQFRVGEPSYTAGLMFEVPLQRRAAQARLERRQLQLRQVTERFEETVQNLMTEVEIAVRDLTAAYQEMTAKYQAMLAAEAEVDYATRRWELLPGDERSASLLLESLLDAQERLAVEEYGFALAQRAYAMTHTELKRATGTLLQQQRIEPVRSCHNGLPQLHFQKQPGLVTPADVFP